MSWMSRRSIGLSSFDETNWSRSRNASLYAHNVAGLAWRCRMSRWMKDDWLLDGKQRLAGQHEPVPERQPAVFRRVAHRFAPRDFLKDHVAQEWRLRVLGPISFA